MEYRVGCSGWSYSAWKGPFYPANLPAGKWLEYYAKVFDYVEVDSSFYAVPSSFRVRKWALTTPADFKFTVKMPRKITHEKAFYNVYQELKCFYSDLAPLREKNLAFLIQMPPFLSFKTGFKLLKNFLEILDTRYRYAVEARQTSWFNDEFYGLLRENKVCLVWNQLDAVQAPPVVTTDFLYVRLIGDRSIAEKDFGRIHKDRHNEITYWVEKIKAANVPLAIVAANNHFQGYGPGTAADTLKMLGQPEPNWSDKEQERLPF